MAMAKRNSAETGRSRGWSDWAKRLLLALLAPVLFLLILEGGLRIVGFGWPTGFFRSLSIQGNPVWVENDAFGLRFFPTQAARAPETIVAPQQKGDALRIAVLGESAAMGDPLSEFGAPRMLEVILRHHITDRPVQVVNAAFTAINSHVIREIARDLRRIQPDVVVIMMGNNEIVGPYGPSALLDQQAALPDWRIRAQIRFSRWRLYQLLLRLQPEQSDYWRGLQSFTEREYAPDDPAVRLVHERFAANLDHILRQLQRQDVRVVLCTIPVNLADWPPFRSYQHPESEAQSIAGLQAMDEADWPRAEAIWRGLWESGRVEAVAAYLLGQALLQQGEDAAAIGWLQRARDADRLPFRATSRMQASIRDRADQPHVTFLDLEALWHQQPDPLTWDRRGFVDHVHFSWRGNDWIARHWATAVLAALNRPAGPTDQPDILQLGIALAAGRLAQIEFAERMYDRMLRPPFSEMPAIGERRQRLEEEIVHLREAAADPLLATLDEEIKRAHTEPTDGYIALRVADLFHAEGDFTNAWRLMERALVAEPQVYHSALQAAVWHFEAGEMEQGMARIDGVRSANPYIRSQVRLEKAVRSIALDPPEVAFVIAQWALAGSTRDTRVSQLVELFLAEGALQEAEQLSQQIWRRYPRSFDAANQVVKAALATGDWDLAARALKRSARLQPDHLDVEYHGSILAYQQGRPEEALERMERLAKRDEPHAESADQWALLMLDHFPSQRLLQRIESGPAAGGINDAMWVALIDHIAEVGDWVSARQLLARARAAGWQSDHLQALTAWVLMSAPQSPADLDRARQLLDQLGPTRMPDRLAARFAKAN